jgi:glutathione synthase/RimK-type ligase-like ATP-grasp enzyme
MERDNPRSFVRAPLYTKYIKKDEEYRVHVIGGEIVAIQRKVLKKEKADSGEPINWKIRNLDNGFIYQREGINPPDGVRTVALDATRLSGLVFGAVDVIFNTRQQRAYVLEINSAPGITGTTVQNYADAFRAYL